MKKQLVYIFFILLSLNSSAQQNETNQHTSFDELMKAGHDFGDNNQFDSAYFYFNKALSKAQNEKNKINQADALMNCAYANFLSRNLFEAQQQYDAALLIYKQLHDKINEANTYGAIASLNGNTGLYNYPKALQANNEAFKIYQQLNDKKKMAEKLSERGSIYSFIGDKNKSINYLKKGLEVYKEDKDSNGIAWSYWELARSYSWANQFKLSDLYNDSALMVYILLKNNVGIKNITMLRGVNLMNQKKFSDAIPYFQQVLKYEIDIKASDHNISINKTFLAKCYKETNAIDKAIDLLKEVIGSGKESNDLNVQSSAYYDLSDCYVKQKDFRSAYESYVQFKMINDSMISTDKEKDIVRKEMQFAFDRKQITDSLSLANEKKISTINLQRQQARTYFGFGAFLVVSVLLFFIFRNYQKQKQANKELKETHKQLIKAEKLAAFGTVATRMAHEIQNPLNFVNNFSELSEELVHEIVASKDEEEKADAAKSLLENLQRINQHGKRASSIVKQLQEHTNKGTAHEFFEDSQF